MKLIFYIVISAAFFFYISEVKITLQPLSISLPKWPAGLGWLLLAIAIGLISYQRHRDGYIDGVKFGLKFGVDKIDVVDPEFLSGGNINKAEN